MSNATLGWDKEASKRAGQVMWPKVTPHNYHLNKQRIYPPPDYVTQVYTSQSDDSGWIQNQECTSSDLANMTRHLAVMAHLIHLMEKWNHILNAWWSFLLPFLKGVYWICWLEEVMVRENYGFLGQKTPCHHRCWEDAKSRLWIILIVSIPQVPLQRWC